MKFAVFNKQGFPKAFYSPDVHGEDIPKEAIRITDEEWLEFINNQGRRKWDFKKKKVVIHRSLTPLDELKQQKLDQLKRELKNFIYSHYDQGTQASFLVLYQQAKRQNNKTILNQIEKVWTWINSVLDYYYKIKSDIKNVSTRNKLNDINWDWSIVEEYEHIELQQVIREFTETKNTVTHN